MTTVADLAKRLDTLEETIAFQDQTIEDLHKVIADQWAEIDGLKRQLGVLGDQLREVEAGIPTRPEPPPPHY